MNLSMVTDYSMCKARECIYKTVLIIHVLKLSIATKILTLEQSLLENTGGMSGLLIFLAEIHTWPRSEKIPLEQHFGIFNGKKQLRQFSHDSKIHKFNLAWANADVRTVLYPRAASKLLPASFRFLLENCHPATDPIQLGWVKRSADYRAS